MDINSTALLLIGFQNEYFSPQGALHSVIEETERMALVRQQSLRLVNFFLQRHSLVIQAPIVFTEDYGELVEPVGVLRLICDKRAFQRGSYGAAALEELQSYESTTLTLPGKRGLNAFSNTQLHCSLQKKGIRHVVILGALTSLCVDTAAREAVDHGYQVVVISDCTIGRTAFEQRYYCEEIMPLYARVMCADQLMLALDCI